MFRGKHQQAVTDSFNSDGRSRSERSLTEILWFTSPIIQNIEVEALKFLTYLDCVLVRPTYVTGKSIKLNGDDEQLLISSNCGFITSACIDTFVGFSVLIHISLCMNPCMFAKSLRLIAVVVLAFQKEN